MLLPSLDTIQTAIAAGTVLSPDEIASLDHDAILDARDGEAFSDKWMESSHHVNEAWARFNPSAETEAKVEDIRREAFMVVSNATVQHEIASYISDDFELIARAVVMDIDDSFIVALWGAYNYSQFTPFASNNLFTSNE